MATTEDHIDAMRSMCERLEKNELVESASVDDWGRYGNFQILVTPSTRDRHTTSRIKALVRKSLPKGAHLREVFGPAPIRDYNPYTRTTKITGYSRKFWVVDIDYQAFFPETNSFGSLFQEASGGGRLAL